MKQRILVLFSAIVMAFAVVAQAPTTEQSTVKVTHLTKADFLAKVMNYEKNPTEWIYLGDKPCLIDFYASWCGPCKRLAPVLDELAQEYAGENYIYKIDTEKERELAAVLQCARFQHYCFVRWEKIHK
jgi:thiol-disulfide isomerase/thioredoxin